MSRPIGTPEELERRRRRAVERVQGGERPAVVARVLGVDRNSVYRWRQQAARGPDGLAAKPHPHRPATLSDGQLRQLETLLAQGAPAHGWANGLWTAARVADLIARRFGKRFHHDHVGRFLRERLGWTPQKPRRRARERDEAAILRWQSEVFPLVARDAQARGAHLVFLDESGFMTAEPVKILTAGERANDELKSRWYRLAVGAAAGRLACTIVSHTEAGDSRAIRGD